jgi:hypothetical protein
MAGAAVARRVHDPTVYPSDDDMGEGSLQRFIAELLRPLVERWLASKGVRELVIFDPEHQAVRAERLRFQVFRRLSKRGLVRVEATNDDRVRSRVLGCFLRAVGDDVGSTRLRIATGASGDELFPTEAEAERAARAEAEAERAARARAEAARTQAEAALAASEAEVARLRAELLRLRGK